MRKDDAANELIKKGIMEQIQERYNLAQGQNKLLSSLNNDFDQEYVDKLKQQYANVNMKTRDFYAPADFEALEKQKEKIA